MDSIYSLTRALDLLIGQGGLKHYLKDRKRFSISAYKMALALKRRSIEIDTVIDVGSNIGQFLVSMNSLYPDAQYFCFEPDNQSYSVLSACTSTMQNAKAYNVALSDENGEISFFSHPYSLINSALHVAPHNKHPNYGDSTEIEVKVPSLTLDSLPEKIELGNTVLLKLDVQGLELRVLKGASDFLSRVQYVLLEIAFEELYVDQPKFGEVHDYLSAMGFRLHAALDFHTGRNAAIIEMDALFLNQHLNSSEQKRK